MKYHRITSLLTGFSLTLTLVLLRCPAARSAPVQDSDIRTYKQVLLRMLQPYAVHPEDVKITSVPKGKYDVVITFQNAALDATLDGRIGEHTPVAIGEVFGLVYGSSLADDSPVKPHHINQVKVRIADADYWFNTSAADYHEIHDRYMKGQLTFAQLSYEMPEAIGYWKGKRKLGTLLTLLKASGIPAAPESTPATEATYVFQVLSVTQSFGSSAEQLGKLSEDLANSPLQLFNPLWRMKFHSTLAAWRKHSDLVAGLNPPIRFKAVNDDLLDATQRFERAAEFIERGLDTLNAEHLKGSSEQMDLATRAMNRVSAKMQETLPTLKLPTPSVEPKTEPPSKDVPSERTE